MSIAESKQNTSIGVSVDQVPTWPVYATLFSSLCIIIGLIWDISWHRTVGRDTFWTYAHLLVQLGGIVAGVTGGWLVLHTTFSQKPSALALRNVSIKIWGFLGPVGAWVCIWGAAMVVVSAPFDDWWHNAYGLDLTGISPPHVVLATGGLTIQVSAILMSLAAHNRKSILLAATESTETNWKFSLAYVGAWAAILTSFSTAILEVAGFANQMQGSFFYRVTSVIFPLAFVALARGAKLRWAATSAAAIYMAITIFMIWTLQLFEATPRLAPIYNAVTHMVPPPFPHLFIVPAFFIDLLMQRFEKGREWRWAVFLGVAFFVTYFVVQWFFADFLLSPHARNFFFAADQWDYDAKLGEWQYERWNADPSQLALFQGLAIALGCAVLSARIGFGIGNAMRRVLR